MNNIIDSKKESVIFIKEKIKDVISVFIKIFSVFMIVLLTVLSLFSFIMTAYFDNKYYEYSEKILYKYDNIFFNFIGVVTLLILGYLIYMLLKNIKLKHLEIFLVIFILVIGSLFIIYLKVPPKADQECIVYGASEFLKGNFQWLEKTGYVGIHPLQIGIILFVELVFKICNSTNFIIIQLLNVLFSAICTYILCKITTKIFKDENVTKILVILLFGFFELLFFNTHVYGNIIGLMFGLISILFTIDFIDKNKWRYIFYISISIAISIILKSNYKIFMIGIILVLIIEAIKNFDVKKVICIFSILFTVAILNKLMLLAVEKSSGKNIDSGIPMISYIYMGIQDSDQPGWYTGYVVNSYVENNYDSDETARYSTQKIKTRVKEMTKQPIKTISFFGNKIKSTWNEPTYQTIWINKPSEVVNEEIKQYVENHSLIKSYYDGILSKVLERYFDYFQIIVYFFSAVSIIYNFKSMDSKKILMIVIVFGGFLFHLLWETKSIYVLTYYFLLLSYAAHGICILYNKVKTKTKSRFIKMEEP